MQLVYTSVLFSLLRNALVCQPSLVNEKLKRALPLSHVGAGGLRSAKCPHLPQGLFERSVTRLRGTSHRSCRTHSQNVYHPHLRDLSLGLAEVC